MCDLDVMGAPSKLGVIRKAAALARVRPTFVWSCEEEAAWRKWKTCKNVMPHERTIARMPPAEVTPDFAHEHCKGYQEEAIEETQ